MVRCWTRSENRLEEEEEEEEQCTDGGSSHFQHKVFWVSLTALLLLIFVALGLIVPLRLAQPPSQLLQIVRISAPDQVGALINQSAVVDQQNDLVTFSVTSHANQTSTVLFDVKHGLICYKPANQESCFLQEMEQSDHENVNSLYQDSPLKSSDLHQIFPDFLELPHNERGEAFRALECFSVPPPCLNSSAHLISSAAPPGIFLQEVDAFKDPTRFCCSAIKTGSQVCRYDFMEDIESVAVRRKELQRHYQLSVNETQRQTEFLGVLAAPQVNTSSLEEPLRALCRNGSIHWTRRAEGPSKQRLVYFCIDICFPSNICVSVCFYYLPE